MEIPTTERLARALEELDDPKVNWMIEKARQGYYDDFKSPLATPEIQLVIDLHIYGHNELAKRVINGEFDCTLEESEAWWNSPETKAEYGKDWEKLDKMLGGTKNAGT